MFAEVQNWSALVNLFIYAIFGLVTAVAVKFVMQHPIRKPEEEIPDEFTSTACVAARQGREHPPHQIMNSRNWCLGWSEGDEK